MADIKVGSLVFVKTRSVTRPIMKIDGSKAVYFRVNGKIHTAPAMEGGRAQKDASGAELPPPNIMFVTNLETGEESTIVVNKVLGSELESNYKDGSYVEKCFAVEKIAPAGNKRYATFQISEIELQAPPASEKIPAKATK
jgi:hypothetical protein